MASLREQNKALRRAAILDATLHLLSVHQPADITTSQIAALANVSSATIFNLIGTRDELLMALAGRVIDTLVEAISELGRQTNGDPIAEARLIVDASVDVLTAESTAYRHLVSEITLRQDIDGANFDPAQLQESAMREAQQRNIIDRSFDPTGLGKQIFASYSAAMMRWALGRIDDAGFLIMARHGLVTVLAATATEDFRDGFRDELIDLSARLASLPAPT